MANLIGLNGSEPKEKLTALEIIEILESLEPWDAKATATAIAPWREAQIMSDCSLVGSSSEDRESLRNLLSKLRNGSSVEHPNYDGIIRAREVLDRDKTLRTTGFKSGAKVGIPGIDRLYTVVPGQLSIVTGHPGSGKSEVIDAFMVLLAEHEGWKFGVFSAENPVDIHIGKLIEKHAGQSVFSGSDRMKDEEVGEAVAWADKHFFFLDHNSTSVDSILKRALVLVQMHGINGLIIDPFNYLDVPLDTDSINRFLSTLKRWAETNHVHVWVIAHPQKMYRDRSTGEVPVPKGGDISGSAAWFAKSDFGLSVNRSEDGNSDFHVWKVRFRWQGETGVARLDYDSKTGRISDAGSRSQVLEGINWSTMGVEEAEPEEDGDLPF